MATELETTVPHGFRLPSGSEVVVPPTKQLRDLFRPPLNNRWRVGGSVGRTIYDAEVDDPDIRGSGTLIGLLDDATLARSVVEQHNAFPILVLALEAAIWADDRRPWPENRVEELEAQLRVARTFEGEAATWQNKYVDAIKRVDQLVVQLDELSARNRLLEEELVERRNSRVLAIRTLGGTP